MHLFLYEFITGGGTFGHPHLGPPHGSLLAEGRAMLEALAADCLAVPGWHVTVLRDERVELADQGQRTRTVSDLGSADRAFDEAARTCDASLLIAPEIDNCLWHAASRVTTVGGRLCGPSLAVIEIASHKQRTAEFLVERGLPTPAGLVWTPQPAIPPSVTYPAVVKPVYGAGCFGVKRVDNEQALRAHVAGFATETTWRVEDYQPGIAASLLGVGTRSGMQLLPPCSQDLTEDCSTYHGSQPLQSAAHIERARALARRVFQVVNCTSGVIGLDFVLGADADGRRDYVIEINPRPTTSYTTLRRVERENLAQRMLADFSRPC